MSDPRQLTKITFASFQQWLRLDKRVKEIITEDTGFNGVSASSDMPPIFNSFLTENAIEKLKRIAGLTVRVVAEQTQKISR
ncbi:hypothetical protein DFH27DRAFT_618247 [Peziza echinospora]|nr:hypothetical protein DFH27DRAFT_618247 [Peziza echinospora]